MIDPRNARRSAALGASALLCAALGFACASEPGLGAGAAAPDAAADTQTLRQLPAGAVVGFRSPDTGAHSWLGIPYAQPPVGERRWRRARSLARWQGTREARSYANACVQFARPIGGVAGKPGTPVGDEDCLTLDVYAPPIAPRSLPRAGNRLPVLLWIYGGGNTAGATSLYDGGRLAVEHNAIVVAVNYRLGPFGWLRHPAFAAEAADAIEASGNFGTLDLIHSLEWLRTNIGAFGGDPANITVFGESAGGLNVLTLLLSPQAAGLFHRAVSQSGGLWANTPAQAENWQSDAQAGDPFSSREVLARIALAHAEASDAASARALVDAAKPQEIRSRLRAVPAYDLLEFYRDPERPEQTADLPRVFGDGTVLPTLPLLAAFEKGDFHRVPAVLGTNRDEQKMFMAFDDAYVRWWFGRLPRLRDREKYARDAQYSSDLWKATGADEIALAISRHQRDVWVYRFDWDEERSVLGSDLGEIVGAAHGLEIDFVMPGVRIPGVAERLYDEANAPSRLALSQQMMSYWSEFALTGDPGTGSGGNLTPWRRFAERDPRSQPAYLIFDTEAGGGVRMANGVTTTRAVVQRALHDSRFDVAERCARLDALARNGNPAYRPEWHVQAGCEKALAVR